MDEETDDEPVTWIDLLDKHKQIRVHKRRCGTCVAWDENRMNLPGGRKEQLFADAAAADSFVPCHQTLPYGGYDAPLAICRAFYVECGERSWPLRYARSQYAITEVEPPSTTWHPPQERPPQ